MIHYTARPVSRRRPRERGRGASSTKCAVTHFVNVNKRAIDLTGFLATQAT